MFQGESAHLLDDARTFGSLHQNNRCTQYWRCRPESNRVSCEASDLQSATLPSRPGTLLSVVMVVPGVGLRASGRVRGPPHIVLWRTDQDSNPGDPFGPGPLAGGWF